MYPREPEYLQVVRGFCKENRGQWHAWSKMDLTDTQRREALQNTNPEVLGSLEQIQNGKLYGFLEPVEPRNWKLYGGLFCRLVDNDVMFMHRASGQRELFPPSSCSSDLTDQKAARARKRQEEEVKEQSRQVEKMQENRKRKSDSSNKANTPRKQGTAKKRITALLVKKNKSSVFCFRDQQE